MKEKSCNFLKILISLFIAAPLSCQIKKRDTVFIYKYDGSLQCKKNSGTPLKQMEKKLGDIQIISSENRSDGLMRIQMCGTPTGQANVYEIQKVDLPKAQKRGFRSWTFK